MKKTQQEALTKNTKRVLLDDLKLCSIERNLEWGRRIHANALESGSYKNTRVATALVNMYAKCGSMVEARQIFDCIRQPDTVSWNSLLFGYADNGEGHVALDLISRMKLEGCEPDSVTYMTALKACGSLAVGSARPECLKRGKQIHLEIGCHMNLRLQTVLIDMYVKCGSMAEAHQVFQGIRHPDVMAYNALLLGYAEAGEGRVALDLFNRMKSRGCAPNSVTYMAAVKACASLAVKQDDSERLECLKLGKEIHSEIGCHLNVYVQTSLVDMYAKGHSMVDAHQVFDGIRHPSVVSWNALLLGYAESGEGLITLDLFSRMKSQSCAPDSITYLAALKACTCLNSTECVERGRRLHSEIGCHLNLYVQNTLIDMYAKGCSMVSAHQVFDSIRNPDLVSWNALLLGYADNGKGLVTLDLFSRMKSEGYAPNSITYMSVLKACGFLGALESGRKVHAEIRELDTVLVTCLVDFYANCGSLVEAQQVFNLHWKTRNLKTWTALLAGYSNFGNTDSAFELFERMQDEGLKPDCITFQCMLLCCSHAGLVGKATECFEAMSSKHGLAPSVNNYSCMLDVLGRANMLDGALVLLQGMPWSPDAVTWMTLLGACRKWKNVEVGRLAFESLVGLDECRAAAYVLMADIYASSGMLARLQGS